MPLPTKYSRSVSPAPRDDVFVQSLFDQMGPTYSVMNVVTSFGFSEFWRWRCARNAKIRSGSRVCDMMAGSGECWRYISGRETAIVSVDFSEYMVSRQMRRKEKGVRNIVICEENAVATSIADASVDHVVSAFGLKTLGQTDLRALAQEIRRILKPGGTFSLLEISCPEIPLLRPVYLFYLSRIIPIFGKLCLGDIESYRMLGRYTVEFDSCRKLIPVFEQANLEVRLRNHFFGCATSLVGTRV